MRALPFVPLAISLLLLAKLGTAGEAAPNTERFYKVSVEDHS